MFSLWELIAVQAAWLAFQGISYLLVQKNAGTVHIMERSFDKKIPLVPHAIFIYVLWFPLIALFPVMLYYCSAECWKIYMASMVLDVLISLVIYRIYPTSFHRPEINPEKISEKCLVLIYKLDYKGLNCMPSMHCSISFIIMFSALGCSTMAGWMQACTVILAGDIVISTVLTKQHVIIDVISALCLAAACFAMVCACGIILSC